MDAPTKARLLASIEADRLVIVCGAGLSMAAPSCLPSAQTIANVSYDRYRLSSDPSCDSALREDLEALADHFVTLGTLKSVFIERLVPWEHFVRPANAGHAAVADLLICGAAAIALSGNFDILIERRAWDYGADFEGSLDGDEANLRTGHHSPLLKFHGCAQRDRSKTLWTKSQLSDAPIAERVEKNRTWMRPNLREKDLLVVGFWSDWAYLNNILGVALKDVTPLSVTVVDPTGADVLEAKAPDLWAVAHSGNVRFQHVQESGAAFLDELRKAFSQRFVAKVLDAGRAALKAETGVPCSTAWLDPPDLGSEDLYGWRRDAEGVPATKPARRKHPDTVEVLGLFHLLLRRAGARATGQGYQMAGRSIRVVNGAGALLGTMRSKFSDEPPAVPMADMVACVGATDYGLPDHIVRTGRPADIVRPAPRADWVDYKQARQRLGL